MPGSIRELWPQVFEAFRDVDVILHAGDLYTLNLVDELNQLAPVYVARGNGDLGLEDERIKDTWILDLGGRMVGLVHHFPSPGRKSDEDMARHIDGLFQGATPHAVVYGHTHAESIGYAVDTLCINPGSPTLPRNQSLRLGTIGFLDIANGNIEASVFQVTKGGIEKLDLSV